MTDDATPLVAVVEDDDDLRSVVCELLCARGYRTLEAANGRAALELLRASEEVPAVILLDLMMPVMNGWEFRREQQADLELRAIPVVLLTARGEAADVAKDVGADAYLNKPVALRDLLNAITRLTGRAA